MEKININYIKEKLKNSYDVKYREIECDVGTIYGVFIDDLCDSKFISEYIFNPLIQHKIATVDLEYIKKEVLPANSIGDINSNDEAISTFYLETWCLYFLLQINQFFVKQRDM